MLGDIMNPYQSCSLCPRNCQINRLKVKGPCDCKNTIRIALAKPFFYEEPPISGNKGSGTIFFSGCNLKCVFCQNMEISTYNKGKAISIQRLSEIMLELQEKGVHNINLVTPTMYVPSIMKAIKKAKKKGLSIPILYNSSGYESVKTIQMLNGYIDIYLPDFKYFDNAYAMKYSKTPDYFENAKACLEEMVKQTGPCVFDENNLLKRGVMVRHLILPGMASDAKKIINYLYNKYHDDIYLSIMNQYTPNKDVQEKNLQRSLFDKEYNEVIDYALDLGVRNAYCQVGGTAKESFIPRFNYEGVKKIKSN